MKGGARREGCRVRESPPDVERAGAGRDVAIPMICHAVLPGPGGLQAAKHAREAIPAPQEDSPPCPAQHGSPRKK
jgi:hypothetical protein